MKRKETKTNSKQRTEQRQNRREQNKTKVKRRTEKRRERDLIAKAYPIMTL
jgi:hypothetical protein